MFSDVHLNAIAIFWSKGQQSRLPGQVIVVCQHLTSGL